MRPVMLAFAALAATALLLAGCSGTAPKLNAGAGAPLDYPPARRAAQVDSYHGEEVADPYRWMEEQATPETRQWVSAQTDLFAGYTAATPALSGLEARVAAIARFDAFGIPVRARPGRRTFWTHRPVDANHNILYTRDGDEDAAREVVNFNDIFDGSHRRLGGWTPSPGGRHVVWSNTSQKGFGWLQVVETTTGRMLPDRLDGVAGGSAYWTAAGDAFFWVDYGESEALDGGATPVTRILYHRLGTPVSSDQVIWEEPDVEGVAIALKPSDDLRFLVMRRFEGSTSANSIHILDMKDRGAGFKPLIPSADSRWIFEGNQGDTFFFQTTDQATRGRLVAVDLARPQRQHWRQVIPHREDSIAAVSHIGGRFVVQISRDARPVVEVFAMDGTFQREIPLPNLGLVGGFSDDPESHWATFTLNSLIDVGTIYKVNLDTGETAVFRRPELAFNPDDFVLRQLFYTSRDGTRIPLYLAHHRDFTADGTAPLYMYGYGHGGWNAFPWFQPHLLAWLELGGAYALPGLRGGGEYGDVWREAGTRQAKQNTLQDFIAAAEYLIENRFTSARRLVANGGSASGVVPAAAAIQRPDLFGAAVIEFPFLDMLRYHHFTAIKGWTGGYGLADNADDYAVLRSYSPLHTLEDGTCYPALLTVVGEEDATTPPLHGYKFTAAAQAAQGCSRPVMLQAIPEAGHYVYGTDPADRAGHLGRHLAFLLRALELDWEGHPAVVSAGASGREQARN